jgi:DNA-binding transcriptional regulator YiaG
MYTYTDGGLTNIIVANGYEEHETEFGPGVSFHDLDGLIRAICLALASKRSPLTAEEFRYLRQALCLSQTSVGRLMGVTDQAVAKWEKKHVPLPKLADFAMRAIYMEHVGGNQRVKDLVEALNVTERVLTIVMRETEKGWQHEEEEVAA